jgi:FixJ family two-component response regulator
MKRCGIDEGKAVPARLSPLEREKMQITLMKLKGMLNKTIADKLDVKKSHLDDVLKKLGKRSMSRVES